MSGSYKPGGYTSVSPIAEKRLTDYRTPIGETLKRPRVWMNVLLFFLYVGAEGGFSTCDRRIR